MGRQPFLHHRGRENLLIGFSKSGYGDLDLLFKHPTVFDAAAAFDFPADMQTYNGFGSSSANDYGTQANFQNNYEMDQSFLNTYKAPFTTQDRIWISEGPLFAGQVRTSTPYNIARHNAYPVDNGKERSTQLA